MSPLKKIKFVFSVEKSIIRFDFCPCPEEIEEMMDITNNLTKPRRTSAPISAPIRAIRGDSPGSAPEEASETRAAAVSHRASAPRGAGLPSAITGRHSAQSTAHWKSHLGSSSWITDIHGRTVQHLYYLPWGEDFVNQRISGYDGARYTFSAKEKDAETGYSYFGSRYYSSDLSIWLSVDPMAAKYPSLSPYTYCADNPVRCVDPNGDSIINAYKDSYDYFLQQYNLAKKKYLNIDNNKDPVEYSNVKNEYDKASQDLKDVSVLYKIAEVAISNVEKYNKQLYDQMNNIKDDKGNAVDIIVTVDYSIGKYANHPIPLQPVCPTSIIVKLNPIANFYEYQDMGEVLSHEFGHLLYIIPHWKDYQTFLETVGTNYNGHNYGDKSGEYADEQTQKYKFNKLFSR